MSNLPPAMIPAMTFYMAAQLPELRPSYREAKFSGVGVISLMVAGLWVSVGERPEMCAELYNTWPIREACLMAGAV